jgi:predicted nucleotidyltransferase
MAEKINPKILKTAGAYVDVLRANHTQFESVWLFGSYASNRADEDSDIDIAVVMPQVRGKFAKELELTRYRRRIDSRIEPHVIDADDLGSSFYKELIRQGIKIA